MTSSPEHIRRILNDAKNELITLTRHELEDLCLNVDELKHEILSLITAKTYEEIRDGHARQGRPTGADVAGQKANAGLASAEIGVS